MPLQHGLLFIFCVPPSLVPDVCLKTDRSLEPPVPQAQLEPRPGHGDQLTKFRDLEVL